MDGDARLWSRERAEGAAAPVGGGANLPGAVEGEQVGPPLRDAGAAVGGGVNLPGAMEVQQGVPGSSSGLRVAAKGEVVIQTSALEKQSPPGINGPPEGQVATPRRSSLSGLLGLSAAKWQWEHRTGWRDYSPEESARLEEHFAAGEWMMRFKLGRGKNSKPREIYYYDMQQFNPSSGELRKIKRVPSARFYQRVARRCEAMKRGLLRGERTWWVSKSRAWFEEERQDREHMTNDQRLEEKYKIKSVWYKIKRQPSFESWCVLCIVANALWLFFESDYNSGSTVLDTDWGWIIGENIFCVWFAIEFIIRCLALRSCKSLIKDWWLLLDFALVVLIVFETWALQIGVQIVAGRSRSKENLGRFSFLRSFRLLRLARIAKLFRVFPELFALLKGVVIAMRSLIYTLIMLFVLTFITGVVFANFSRQDEELEEAGFPNVAGSMWTLMINGIFMDSPSGVLISTNNINGGYAFLLLVFMFLSSMTLLNLLIGILADVVSRVSSSEMEKTTHMELELTITEILECYDVDDNGQIKRAEFQKLTSNDDLARILRRHGIDIEDLKKLEDVLYDHKDDHLSEPSFGFAEFLEKICQLRGGNNATVNDIAELRSSFSRRMKKMEMKLDIAPSMFSSLSSPEIDNLQSEPGDSPERRLTTERSESPRSRKPLLAQVTPADPETPAALETPAAAAISSACRDFQAALLAQLAAFRQDQQALRGEVKGLNDKVRMLQEGFVAAVGGVV